MGLPFYSAYFPFCLLLVFDQLAYPQVHGDVGGHHPYARWSSFLFFLVTTKSKKGVEPERRSPESGRNLVPLLLETETVDRFRARRERETKTHQ